MVTLTNYKIFQIDFRHQAPPISIISPTSTIPPIRRYHIHLVSFCVSDSKSATVWASKAPETLQAIEEDTHIESTFRLPQALQDLSFGDYSLDIYNVY